MAIVTGLAVLLGIVLVAIATRPPTAPALNLVSGPTTYPADLTDGTSLGSPNTPVVIDLYADFQCPACQQFVTMELPQLVTDYVKPGIVRIQAHDLDILGRGSPDESLELAAGGFCAAQQDRYWQYHDLVFWNQGPENRGVHNAAFIAAVADQAGVDPAAWQACFARTDIRAPIVSATRASGVTATPTLRINGQQLVGVPAYADLVALIERLAAASPNPS